jgi:C-terminal processing protease CtpA/Prc
MKRGFKATALLAVLILAGTPAAGPLAGPKAYKCPLDAQTCLNKMVAGLKSRGWLGIEYNDAMEADPNRITKVVPGSPAEQAGFKAGDVLVSLDGAKYADITEDRCAPCEFMKKNWVPGRKIRFVVSRGGKEVPLTATLASLPADVLAIQIGMHMLGHAEPPPPSK